MTMTMWMLVTEARTVMHRLCRAGPSSCRQEPSAENLHHIASKSWDGTAQQNSFLTSELTYMNNYILKGKSHLPAF